MSLNKKGNYPFYFAPFSLGGKILNLGSLITFLLAILRSKVSNKDGNRIKLEIIAKRRVIDTRPPSAMVPPKLEMVNTKKPKNNTMEV